MQLKIEMIKYCSIATPNKNVKFPEVRFQEAIEIFVHLPFANPQWLNH